MVGFARWLRLQEAVFGDLTPAINRYFNRRQPFESRSGHYGRDYRTYMNGELSVSPRRAFEIGQAIGYETTHLGGFASGPIALLAAGHVSTAIDIIGQLLMAPLGRKNRQIVTSRRDEFLLGSRFIFLPLDFLRNSNLRQRLRYIDHPVSSLAHSTYEFVGKGYVALAPEETPRRIYVEFMFEITNEEDRYRWALDRFGKVRWLNRHEIVLTRKRHPLAERIALASHVALAVTTYPAAAEMAWRAFRGITDRIWQILAPIYDSDKRFSAYVARLLPRVAAKYDHDDYDKLYMPDTVYRKFR